MTTYYAISSVGYGKGETPAEARETHQEYAVAAKPSFVSKKDWMAALENEPVQVFIAPEEATGFVLDAGVVYWVREDGRRLGRADACITCPRCGADAMDETLTRNALSRKDNQTYVCSPCGTSEAFLEDPWPGYPGRVSDEVAYKRF